MTGSGKEIAPFDLPLPAVGAEYPLDSVLDRSGKVFMAVLEASGGYPPPDDLQLAVERASSFLDEVAGRHEALREALRVLEADEVRERLGAFVMSWPNAPKANLTVFGATLLRMVEARRPTRYALEVGLERVVETSDFVPSIAEVLRSVDAAQARVRNTAFHVNELPAALDKARVALARVEARQASIERHRSEQAALREKAEMQPGHLQ